MQTTRANANVIVLLSDGMEGDQARDAQRVIAAKGVQTIPLGIDCDIAMDGAVNIPADTLNTRGLNKVIEELSC
jgi:hypothetical protein